MGATRIFSLSRRSSELLVAPAVSQILIVKLMIHEERADRFDLRHVEHPVGVRVSHIEQVVRRLKCLLLVAQPDLQSTGSLDRKILNLAEEYDSIQDYQIFNKNFLSCVLPNLFEGESHFNKK